MKALIRNEGETITDNMDIPCIDWKTGTPLTDTKWFGGPYTLVDNYVPQVSEEDTVHPKQPEIEEEIVEDEVDYVIIDGKKYNKEELRSLLK